MSRPFESCSTDTERSSTSSCCATRERGNFAERHSSGSTRSTRPRRLSKASTANSWPDQPRPWSSKSLKSTGSRRLKLSAHRRPTFTRIRPPSSRSNLRVFSSWTSATKVRRVEVGPIESDEVVPAITEGGLWTEGVDPWTGEGGLWTEGLVTTTVEVVTTIAEVAGMAASIRAHIFFPRHRFHFSPFICCFSLLPLGSLSH